MRLLPLLLVATFTAQQALADETRPPVDAEAMEEALVRPGQTDPYSSARAYLHYLRAQLADQRGDLDTAMIELRDASIYDGASLELRLQLAWMHARKGHLDRAAELAARHIARRPRDAEAHLLVGKIRRAQRRKAEARRALLRAIELAPKQREAYLELARLHAEFGEVNEARAVARRHAARFPGDGTAYRALARVATERGEEQTLRTWLALAVEQDPDDAGSRLRLAAMEERDGRLDRAATLYHEALALQPNEPDALLASGRLALRRGEFEVARAFFSQLLGTAADPRTARLQVAGLYREARRFDEALEVLEVVEEPDARIHYIRGLLLKEAGREAEAAEAFARVPPAEGDLHLSALALGADSLSLHGRHAEAISAVGRAAELLRAQGGAADELVAVIPDVYRRAGRSAEAVSLLRQLRPGTDEVPRTIALARALQDAGKREQAFSLLRKARKRHPDDERIVFAHASAQERAGDPLGAIATMRGLLRVHPDHAAALNFVGYLLADQGVRLDEARALLERALALRPDEPAILDSLGWCELRRGDLDAATRLLERARELAPRDPVVLQHLGEAYARSGRHLEARALLQAALVELDRDPDPRLRSQVSAALQRVQTVTGRQLGAR